MLGKSKVQGERTLQEQLKVFSPREGALCLGAGQYTSYGAHQQPQKREAIQIQGPCKEHNQKQKEMEPKTCLEASDSTHQGHTRRGPGV